MLVPPDGSEISDIALRHAIYLSKISNAEIIIINIIEEDVISPSTLLSFIRKEEEGGLIQSKEDLRNMEGAIKKMFENKVKKFNNLELHLSYKVLAGKPANEIIKFSEESDIDLIVMASSRISSTIRIIGSTVRKVIDSTSKPVLVIHE
ncbi:MAG: universal stress protein [Nitrososphaeraceae archaeon]